MKISAIIPGHRRIRERRSRRRSKLARRFAIVGVGAQTKIKRSGRPANCKADHPAQSSHARGLSARPCAGSAEPQSRKWKPSRLDRRKHYFHRASRRQSKTLAEQKSLEAVRQHALEKQAALTTDPVNRLQLRYRLVQLYENRRDFLSAQRCIEALYRENPKILGVVRSTVDFYWRIKMLPAGHRGPVASLDGRVSGIGQAVCLRSGTQVDRRRTISTGTRSVDQTSERFPIRRPIPRGDGRYLRPG